MKLADGKAYRVQQIINMDADEALTWLEWNKAQTTPNQKPDDNPEEDY